MDREAYIKALKEALPLLQRPATKTALDQYIEEVVLSVQSAIEKTVLIARVLSRSREGQNDKCREVLAETKRLKRAYNQLHTEETQEAYQVAQNHKARTIKKALRDKHREQVEKAAESPEGLWKIAKQARTREAQFRFRISPKSPHNGLKTAKTANQSGSWRSWSRGRRSSWCFRGRSLLQRANACAGPSERTTTFEAIRKCMYVKKVQEYRSISGVQYSK